MAEGLTSDTEIAAHTIGHYESHAESYRAGTRDHDVSQNITALLEAIRAEPPFDILDLGCGPGRDLATFSALGHRAIGLDGSPRFVRMARTDTACAVWQQDLLALDLPAAAFDGVFANAVLFHIPSAALPRVLSELYACLKPAGVLFLSNPRGPGQEGWFGERFGHYCDLPQWRAYLEAAGFSEITHYYRPPGRPRDQQPWLAGTWRKAPVPD